MRARRGGRVGLPFAIVDRVANLPSNAHSRMGAIMRKSDLIPLVAWIIWEMLFEEPESTDPHRKEDQKWDSPEGKTPPRISNPATRRRSSVPSNR